MESRRTGSSALSAISWLKEVVFRRGETCLVEAESGVGKSSLCSFIYGRQDVLACLPRGKAIFYIDVFHHRKFRKQPHLLRQKRHIVHTHVTQPPDSKPPHVLAVDRYAPEVISCRYHKMKHIGDIVLHGVLPSVFAGISGRESQVWLKEVVFRRGETCLVEAESGVPL